MRWLLLAYFWFQLIESLLGLSNVGFRPKLLARLTNNIPSQAGREDWVPARLLLNQQENQVDPIFSKSNLIFSLVRANCLIRVPADATGISAGELVDVYLLT